MNSLFRIFAFILPLTTFAQNFPESKKTPNELTKHNIPYTDDYMWLQNMNSKETISWIKAQNSYSEKHNAQISKSIFPLPVIKKYNAKTQYRIPVSKGKYYYLSYAKVLGYQKDIDARPVKLIDANFIYNNKVVNIESFYPSNSSRHLAYKLAIDGSDAHELRFLTIDNLKHHPDIIKNIKFSNIAWKGDEGVYYKKNCNTLQFDIDSTFQMLYHKIGTDPLQDKVLFDTTKSKNWFNFFSDENNNSLFVVEEDIQEGITNYYRLGEENSVPVKFYSTKKQEFDVIAARKDTLFISNKKSNWGDVAYIRVNKPDDTHTLIPEVPNHLLTETILYNDRILCKYRTDEESYIVLYNYNGKLIKKVQGPKGMDVKLYGSNYNATTIYFSLQSHTIPPLLFKLDLFTGNYSRYINDVYPKTTAPFGIDYFETKKTTYTSRDGVQIPITLIYKKGINLNADNPTLLEAYGGFGVVSTSFYDTGRIYFLESGGVYAYAEIRGGGEKGIAWHNDGKVLNKKNSLNDFIDAAEFLIKEKYTSSQRLAITGASHGGLVVANALVQRPELFKVAIPKVGVYDMLEKFNYTNAYLSMAEYGNPDIKEHFEAMMAYSPYHNIKEDINYPITYILTFQNDDRVPPFHSYKFAARLQNRKAQKNPIYLKAIEQAGHYGIMTNQEEYTEDKSEFYAFLLYHLKQ